MAEIPQLAGLYKKYADQGFHLVGLECQGSTADAITTMMKSKNAEYQVTTNGDLKGAKVSGIPHGFLFGPDGKLAADDARGKKLEDKIKELITECGAALAGPGPYKKLAPLAAQIKSGQGLGNVLNTLRTKKSSKNAAEAAEAQMMFDSLGNVAQRQLDRALEAKKTDVVGALAQMEQLATKYAGDQIGTTARKEADTLKRDPQVVKELQADYDWKQIEFMVSKLRPYLGQSDPKLEPFRRDNRTAIKGIVAACQALSSHYPGTACAKKADDLVNAFTK